MKNILIILIVFLFISCKEEPKKEKNTIKPTVEKIIEEPKPKPIEKIDNKLISLSKEPCSGDCPVFKVSITKDSILTYTGIQYTKVSGSHKIKLSGKQYAEIVSIIDRANFSKLEDRYTMSGTKDYSLNKISHQGKTVTVRLWKDAPKRLTDIYVFIEDLLYDQRYLE